MNNSESNGNTQNNEDVMYETNRIKCDQGKRNQLQLQFRFLRPRRPSEEQSDSEDKLFIPVPYHGVRPNFVSNASKPFTTKAEFEEIPLSKKVMDLNFINIPLTPDNEVAQESLPKSAGQISSEVQSSHYKREEIFCESRQTTAHAQIPVKDQVSRHLRTLSAPPAFDYEEKPDEKRSFQHTFDSAFDHGCHLERFDSEKSRSFSIVDSLLFEIYDKRNFGRRLSGDSDACTEYSTMSEGGLFNKSNSATFSSCNPPASVGNISMVAGRSKFKRAFLENKGSGELLSIVQQFQNDAIHVTNELVRQLKLRDRLLRKRDCSYDIITAILQASSPKRRVDTRMRFSVEPFSGDSGFAQWHDAMRMVARLPGGIPWEFRKRLWLTMAEKHIQHRKVDWDKVKRFCFNERSNPDDNELGVQIVKDLHRTGCSLFCGEDAEHNQALLKRVLLAYARWNKTVGYCQGFNMLAALILEVLEWKEEDALKVMIYLIEGVLPESYFANNLSGLSVDMAVFRDLLRMRIPGLSRHLDHLQHEARDSVSGTSYEPPLTNVFTMQWFLTLFSNCLPKSTVLRVWDLIFLEGNEVLLRTTLTIWDGLADRIMAVNSADEFYSIMGVLTREMLAFGLMDANHLVKTICTMAPFPFPQLSELRDKYRYNITPFTAATAAMGVAKRGLRLFYSDDEEDNEEEALAVAAWCFSSVFPPQLSPIKNKDALGAKTPSPSSSNTNFSSIGPGAFGATVGNFLDPVRQTPDADRMSLDISALKKQYAKLRERQKQAHIILTAANTNRQNLGRRPPTVAMNHLLIGKKSLASKTRKGSTCSLPSTGSTANFQVKATHDKLSRANSKKESKLYKVPLTRSEVNIKGARQTFPGGVMYMKDRKNSLPTPESGETLHWRDARRQRDSDAVITKDKKKETEEKNDGDASSTSTELCDEDIGKLSDLGSDIENEDGRRHSPTPSDVDKKQGSPLTRRFTAIDSRPSIEESSDCDTASVFTSMTISTPTTATARNDSLPSVVVSPGEWSREDWPDWSRTSVDELGEDSEILSEVAKDTVQSFNHDSLTEWLESVTVRTRNRFQSETSDFLRQAEKGISEEPLLTSRIEENSIHSEQREDEQSGNEDDDYSEEKRLEWLAKLEMYRRTLGVDSFDLNDGKKEHVDNFTESHKMETVLTTEAAGASLTYVESQYTKTTCISSDEFHSLSSEHTQWDDDDVEITHRKAVEEIEMPSLNYFLSENLTERANKNGFGGSQSDEDDQWHKCLSDVDGSSSDTTSTAMMMSKLNLKQPDEDIIIPISRLDDNGISQTMGSPKLTALRYNKSFSKDGETDEHYSSPHVSRILQKESSYSKSDVGKVSSKDCSIQSDIFSTKVPSVTSSQSILADFYKTMPRPRDVVSWHEQDQLANSQQDCEQDSENRQLKIDKKAKSPVFNPFPVARTSQIWGSSGIGVKLGLYDPSTAGSISQKTVKKQNQR